MKHWPSRTDVEIDDLYSSGREWDFCARPDAFAPSLHNWSHPTRQERPRRQIGPVRRVRKTGSLSVNPAGSAAAASRSAGPLTLLCQGAIPCVHSLAAHPTAKATPVTWRSSRLPTFIASMASPVRPAILCHLCSMRTIKRKMITFRGEGRGAPLNCRSLFLLMLILPRVCRAASLPNGSWDAGLPIGAPLWLRMDPSRMLEQKNPVMLHVLGSITRHVRGSMMSSVLPPHRPLASRCAAHLLRGFAGFHFPSASLPRS